MNQAVAAVPKAVPGAKETEGVWDNPASPPKLRTVKMDDNRNKALTAAGAGKANREIARVTGLSESNIGTIAHRAIGTLREQW